MATAAAAAGQVDDSVCSICHESFTAPKLIPCGHLFCRHCLLDWLTSQPLHAAQCPLCRRPIVAAAAAGGGQRQSPADIVDSLPTEASMEVWVKSKQLLQQEHGCQSCVTQAATSLCLHCHDFLCTPCSAMHGRLSCSRHHTVESLSTLTPETLAAGGFPATCPTHTGEVCQLYCYTHHTPLCLLCASTQHKTCARVTDLQERVEETRTVLREVEAALRVQESRLNQAIQELDALFQEMEEKAQAAQDEISLTFDRVEAAVKERRHQAVEATRHSFDEAKRSIQEGKSSLLEMRGVVTTHITIAERGKGMAASGDMGDLAVAMKKRVGDTDADGCCQLPADAPDIKRAEVVIDTDAVVSRVEEALAQVGQYKLTPADVKAQMPVLYFHKNCGENITLSNNRQMAEKKGGELYRGIIVFELPMLPHRLYEVRLDVRDAFNSWYMWTGVVTTDPGVMILPSNADGWTSAVVFNTNRIDDHGERIYTDVGKKLVNLPRGSRIGLLVDGSQDLHLYIDGQDQGIAGVKVAQPCYAFFDVCGPYRKVTAQPVRRIP